MQRPSGRTPEQLRDVRIQRHFTRHAEGSVLIEFGDASGARWSTVGVSANIIDASFQALTDAINYKLMKAGA